MNQKLEVKDVIRILKANAVGGKKVPHGVSNPVFRRDENGNIVVAAFVYFYTADDLKNQKVRRPAKWITLDISTGETTAYSCNEKDFCSIKEDFYCELRSETDTKFSKEYCNQTLAVFDLILRKYQITRKFDNELNDAYMYMMLKMVSVGFKELYTQLNSL